ncbi:MAG: AAA family ATPase [Candidatus Dormibacteria bacterium]
MDGFRAFGGSVSLDLDADAVVVVGVNGSGKTSVFDAILWALSGKVRRLGSVDAPVLSMWSESGDVRVRLHLRDATGGVLEVTRTSEGPGSRLTLNVGGTHIPEALAAGTLVERLWPIGLNNPDASAALAVALTRAVYLQQDNVRDFIDASSDEDRFKAISELIGAGAVTQLQAGLENSRNLWSRASTAMSQDLPALRDRVALMEAQMERLAPVGSPEAVPEERWRRWLDACFSVGIGSREIPPWTSSAATLACEELMRELGGVAQQIQRRERELDSVAAELIGLVTPATVDAQELTEAVSKLGMDVDSSRQALLVLRQNAADQARQEAVRAEQTDDLRRLAAIALRHLDERCPVCDQNFDRESTRVRLTAFMASEDLSTMSEQPVGSVAAAAQAHEALENELASRQAALEAAAQAQREFAARTSYVNKRLADLGLTDGERAAARVWLQEQQIEAVKRSNRIRELRSEGEQLLLERARMLDTSRRGEVEQELARLKSTLAELEQSLAMRDETKDLATRLIDATRSARDDLVSERLKAVEPLARRIYQRIDPHPAFKNVNLRSWLLRGKGHMAPQLEDPVSQKVADQPGLVLSSSQANALAVAVFLAVNLGVGDLPLEAALLDDPLQSLDDVNLLGLVDLLRRVKQRRQLIVSTHDRHFGELLARKLRPTTAGGRTVVIELRDWQREGPIVLQQSLQPSERAFQIVA